MENPKQYKVGDKPWPLVPLKLVEQLELVYPDRCPTADMPEREVWMAAGAAAVVRKLRQVHSVQTTNVIHPS